MTARAAAAALATTLLCASPALAYSVPHKKPARAWVVRKLPPVAPAAMLRDQRADAFDTQWVRVEKARSCERNALQVECAFRLRLAPKKHAKYDPVACHGEAWVRRQQGRLVGRIGNYVCHTVR